MLRVEVAMEGLRLEQVLESSKGADVLIEALGVPAAVLVSPDRYESLVSALEELQDLKAFDEAMTEPGDNVPMDRLNDELDLR